MEQTARIFVAGHTGMVGTTLTRTLQERGFRNIITRTSDALDLTDREATQRFFREEKPEYVFFAAGKVGGILANTLEPVEFLTENISMQNNVLLSAKEAGVKKLLFFGSACIYPRITPQPIPEDALLTSPLEPSNQAYAIAKIAGITLCQSLRKEYDCNFISVMPTNLYGPGDNMDLQTSHVIPALMRKIHEAKVSGQTSVDIWGAGFATRDFLYVQDCAEACLHLMDHYNSGEIMNIGTGEETSIRTLAELLRTIIGYEGSLEFCPQKLEGVSRRYLDVRRVHTLGWHHRFSLEEGLTHMYSWFRKEQEIAPSRQEIASRIS